MSVPTWPMRRVKCVRALRDYDCHKYKGLLRRLMLLNLHKCQRQLKTDPPRCLNGNLKLTHSTDAAEYTLVSSSTSKSQNHYRQIFRDCFIQLSEQNPKGSKRNEVHLPIQIPKKIMRRRDPNMPVKLDDRV